MATPFPFIRAARSRYRAQSAGSPMPRMASAGPRGGAAALTLILALTAAAPGAAQDRAGENALDQADDAFGFRVGRETIGIYTAGNTRGFSPTAAGNVRIDGLYFDPAFALNGLAIDSVGIKVGLSAQGYPFSAPSGVVDQTLRRPASESGASLLASADSFGSAGVELTGSLPVNDALALGYGLAGNHVQFPDGTSNWNHDQALIARWRPSADVEITPFWTLSNDYDDEAGTLYVPVDGLPPEPEQRRFDGPEWVDIRYQATNHGVIAAVRPASGWLVRAGGFRSVLDQSSGFANLMVDVRPDGTGRRLVYADPPVRNVSMSGELRVARAISDGPRSHRFLLNLRGRDARRSYGGEDVIDLGEMRIGEPAPTERPIFVFGEQTRDQVRQTSYGLAYIGQWRDRGELGFSVSRVDYSKDTRAPGVAPILSRSRPWLYAANIAVQPWNGVTVYAGVTRGLEESGVAPPNAANRNAPLPAILTRQADAGIRVEIRPELKAIVGVFDLERPYFGYDTAGRYTQVGATRSRGLEFSLNGALTERLTLIAGGVLLDPRVDRQADAVGMVGERPAALADRILNLGLSWRAPWLEGLTLDGTLFERSGVPATTDNSVWLPGRTRVDLGARYRFALAERGATLRVQVSNALDERGFGLAGPGIYAPAGGRSFSAYLAVDF